MSTVEVGRYRLRTPAEHPELAATLYASPTGQGKYDIPARDRDGTCWTATVDGEKFEQFYEVDQ